MAEPSAPTSPVDEKLDDATSPAIIVRAPIFFEFGTAKLTAKSEAFVAETLAVALASDELKTFDFSIEGHTDDVGSAVDNQTLSQKRADSVKQLLIAHGVSESRLEARGHGGSLPRHSNATEEGRIKNRRVEVINQGVSER